MSGIKPIFKSLRDASRPLRRRLRIKPLVERLKLKAAHRIARVRRRQSKSTFVGITGSSGKSTTTALLTHILELQGTVYSQIYDNTLAPMIRSLSRLPRDANHVVIEVGITKVGCMAPMAELLSPDVAVVTKVGIEHYGAFRGRDAVAVEKGQLVEALPETGLAVLNADDPHVLAMRQRCRARAVTFGWSVGADYRVVGTSAGLPERLTLRLICRLGDFELRTPFAGEEFWLAAAAAFACAVEMGVDPHAAAMQIASFEPPWDRCGVVDVAGGPSFIVDTVKAPAESIAGAITVLRNARSPLKRAVIGQISDYTGDSRKPYRNAYKMAREAADQVIFVGDHIHRAPATDQERQDGTYAGCATAQEAANHIRQTATAGEIILLKGSRNLHLERIAMSWTHSVRCWENKCGKQINCLQCGMFAFPYAEHGKVRRAAKRDRFKFWRRLRRA